MKEKLLVTLAKKKRVLNFKFLSFYESVRGLDTMKYVDVDDLEFNKNVGYRYEWTSPKLIKRVLKDLHIKPSDSIIDVGSGKGKALISFSKFPFHQIAGLELSKELVNISMRNMQILGLKNIEHYNENAVDFDHYDKFNYIYFYNPFPEPVFQLVLKKIISSLKNRTVYIIYKNPTCYRLLDESPFFSVYKKVYNTNIAFPGLDNIFIYKSV